MQGDGEVGSPGCCFSLCHRLYKSSAQNIEVVSGQNRGLPFDIEEIVSLDSLAE